VSAEDVDGDDRDDGEGGDLGADRLMVDERDRLPRRHREGSNRSDSDQRSSSQRDLARVLYSPYFQRLSGVTQIISPDPRVPQLHNRQTHSLKVALVSSEVAEEVIRQARTSEKDASAIKALGGIDSVICEVAGLAHDLGHPPFGHLGESLLDQFMRYEGPFPLAQGDKEHQEEAPSQADVSVEDDALAVCKTDAKASFGFEGNAQSFRIVTRLDRHKVAATPGSPLVGLDLTSASLAAILKYPWWRSSVRGPGPKEKYNVYPEDVATFIRARRWTLGRVGLHQQTLEASIMDLADDITYAVHDLQDFIFAGMVDSRDVVKMLRQQEILMGNAGYTDFAGNDKRLIEERLLLERQKDRVAPALEEAYRRAAAAQAGFANRDDYVKALAWARELFEIDLNFHYVGTLRQDSQIRKAFGDVVGEFVGEVAFHDVPAWADGPSIYPDAGAWHKILVLKTLCRSLIVQTVHVGAAQRTQRRALTNLLRRLNEWLLSEPPLNELPEPLRTFLREESPDLSEHARARHTGIATRRLIVDHVSSLTDFKAMQWSEWLQGRSLPVLGDL